MNNNKWSRRKFSKAVISAQLLMASGAITIPLACAKTKKSEGGGLLDSDEQQILKSTMDEIIPANKKMPSASAIGGVTYILKIVEELPELLPLFQNLAEKIATKSLAYSKVGFSELKRAERVNLLIDFEASETELFKVLKDFTYESYYTNEAIYSSIGYEPHPTGTAGPKMEPFDENLLNKVKKLPSMYTKI